MSQLEPRHVRLYGPAFALHDVRDVEAHVRTLLDAYLRERGARLDSAKYNDALAYLVAICWMLSGLTADGRSRRVDHFVQIYLDDPAGALLAQLGPFRSRELADDAVRAWCARNSGLAVVVAYLEQTPRGAYDPKRGLAFSTYSRRILSRRVVDWYRATFGDSRYGGNTKPMSLDQLVEDWESRQDGAGAAESYLDHNGPGAHLDFVDELNRHAYYDPFEERDTRSITETGGPDRVAAAR